MFGTIAIVFGLFVCVLAIFGLSPSLQKLFKIGSNKINEQADKIVANNLDMKREGNQMISQMTDRASKLEEKLKATMAQVNLNNEKAKKLRAEAKTFESAAIQFVGKGEDDKARKSLLRVEILEKTASTFEKSIAEIQPVIEDRKLFLHQVKADRDALRFEIERMDIEYEAAKLKAEMLGGDAKVVFNIQDLRDRLESAKATATAAEEFKSEFGSTDQEDTLSQDVVSLSVEDRLAKLKENKSK